MLSIIKSHFHKGKTGFIITGLFVILSVFMMIIGVSICLGLDTLYINAREITNSPDYTIIDKGGSEKLTDIVNELVEDNNDNIKEYDVSKSIIFTSSTEQLTDFLQLSNGKGGNINYGSFTVMNIDNADDKFIPRIRDTIENEGFKLYVSGNFLATTALGLNVGSDVDFFYNGEIYKGYIAGVFDSMTTIYGNSLYFVDQAFYSFLESKIGEDEDISYASVHNIGFKFSSEKECEQLATDFRSKLERKIQDYNVFPAGEKINAFIYTSQDFVNATKSFIMLLGAALIAFSVLIAVILAIVISFLVRASVIDDARNLGVLKSLGYTTNMLRLSYLAIYGAISAIGMLIGIILGISLMPEFVNIVTAMARLDCSAAIGLNVGSIFAGIALIALVISAIVTLATAKINSVTTLSAMRNNLGTHTFKRNLAPLAHTKTNANVALGVKSVVGERGRSVTVTAIVLLMSFLCSFVSVVFYNLKVDQTAIINMSGIEVPDYFMGFDYENNTPYFDAIRSMDGYEDDRMIIDCNAEFDGKNIYGRLYEDFDNIRTNLVYEGRLPKYANEIMLEVSTANDRGYSIGDTLTFKYIFSDYGEPFIHEFVVVGYFQSITDSSKYVAFIDGVPEICDYVDLSQIGRYFYFDKDNCPTGGEIREHIMKTLNIDSIRHKGFISGKQSIDNAFLGVVETTADAVMTVFLSITAVVISLLLVMVIKLKLLREKRNYAIYKALGYTTANIMSQIAVAMVMLSVIGGVIGCIVGALATTPILSLAGGIIGIGRFAFAVPWGYIAGLIFGIPALTYLVSMLCAIPVRKIAPATLLRERG